MTDTAIAPPATETREFFYLMNVQEGHRAWTIKNTVVIPAGDAATRLDLYNEIYQMAQQQTGAQDLMVTYFSLEPNQL